MILSRPTLIAIDTRLLLTAKIDASHSRDAFLPATARTRQPLDVPDIRGYDACAHLNAGVKRILELRERRWNEISHRLKPFHLTVAAAKRNYRDNRCSAPHRVFDGVNRPLD
jgi:hypothetical protein